MVNLALLGRVTYLLATRDVQVRVAPLVTQQIIERGNLNANTCARAVFLANTPDATPIQNQTTIGIDAKQANIIGEAVLNNEFTHDLTQDALTTAPMLLTADVFDEQRTVWGQLWLPPAESGSYDDSTGVVLYIDAVAAVPLLLFTDVDVKDTTDASCIYPTTVDRQAQYRTFAPFLYGTAMMFISFGLVLDYRQRITRFANPKRH